MFYRLFKEHPEAVQETYVQHAIFASRFALKLAAAAGAALVHAVVPALFEKQQAGLWPTYMRKRTIVGIKT